MATTFSRRQFVQEILPEEEDFRSAVPRVREPGHPRRTVSPRRYNARSPGARALEALDFGRVRAFIIRSETGAT